MRGLSRWLLGAIVAVVLGAAACGHPEACPEPCPDGMYCNYGACVPYHNDGGGEDAGEDGGTG
ncbi:MAG: hypothetical protein HY905_08295 [Deltaproteobacteria bacterium]|nr:hypothetical protein [Deltaproteobacteria bacterium]